MPFAGNFLGTAVCCACAVLTNMAPWPSWLTCRSDSKDSLYNFCYLKLIVSEMPFEYTNRHVK